MYPQTEKEKYQELVDQYLVLSNDEFMQVWDGLNMMLDAWEEAMDYREGHVFDTEH